MAKPDYYGVSSSPSTDRCVARVERSTSGPPLTIYHLLPGLARRDRLAVLAELRVRHPGVTISAIGDEVAVFALDLSASAFEVDAVSTFDNATRNERRPA